jgi:hypothetical protein
MGQPLQANPLRVQVPARYGGGTRDPKHDEALAMTLSALATVSQWTDVSWTTITDAQGRPTTLLTLAGVQGEEKNGRTFFLPTDKSI